MVFNATFNHISVISWRSVLLEEKFYFVKGITLMLLCNVHTYVSFRVRLMKIMAQCKIIITSSVNYI